MTLGQIQLLVDAEAKSRPKTAPGRVQQPTGSAGDLLAMSKMRT